VRVHPCHDLLGWGDGSVALAFAADAFYDNHRDPERVMAALLRTEGGLT
jgi:hypothetical protein